MADVRLVVLVPAELKAALEAQAKAEDRTLASLVRRMLSSEDWERRAPASGPGSVGGPYPTAWEAGLAPIGGQDAAAGKGVEERTDESSAPDLLGALESSIEDARSARQRPVDHVVIGGADCTHPLRFQMGRRCEAPGCGKVVR